MVVVPPAPAAVTSEMLVLPSAPSKVRVNAVPPTTGTEVTFTWPTTPVPLIVSTFATSMVPEPVLVGSPASSSEEPPAPLFTIAPAPPC